MRRPKGAVPYRPWLVEEMRKDRRLAGAYLDAAMEDDDPRVVLSALRTVSEAQGMAKIAEAAGIARESLYRALSPKGNPRLSTLFAILKAAGYRLALEERTRQGA